MKFIDFLMISLLKCHFQRDSPRPSRLRQLRREPGEVGAALPAVVVEDQRGGAAQAQGSDGMK